MKFALEGEMGVNLDDVVDFNEVCERVHDQFDDLIEHPNRCEPPKIYHLDVGAMYPNIILTNRLQPPAMITDTECLSCVHNTPDAKCKRSMNWVWRGDLGK